MVSSDACNVVALTITYNYSIVYPNPYSYHSGPFVICHGMAFPEALEPDPRSQHVGFRVQGSGFRV